MSKSTDYFNKEGAQKYDERNAKLARISDCLHFLTTLALTDRPERSRVLCVGVGTGAEILTLAQAYPKWSFVGIEPSKDMLDVCRDRLAAAGFLERCELVHGYVHELPKAEPFDVAVSFLVTHFIKRDERLNFFKHMTGHLRNGGVLVNAEIGYDLESSAFPAMLKNWEQVQGLMGATPESLAALPKVLREMLTVLPPDETENLLRQSGIPVPVRFFQAMMIHAWHGVKGE